MRRNQQHRQSPPSVVRIGFVTATQELRRYYLTAVLLGFTLLGAVCAIVPVVRLFGRPDDWLGFRPVLRPVSGGDLGFRWLMGVSTPTQTQEKAVSELGALLLYTLWGTILVVIVTIVSIGLARSLERRSERLIQRSVGASRRTLLMAALAELVMVAAFPMLLGYLIGFGVAQSVEASWPGSMAVGTSAATAMTTMLVLSVLAAVLLIPAITSPRRATIGEMNQPLPTFPIVFQIAVCSIVLTAGALLTDRANNLWTSAPGGLDRGSVVSITMNPGTPQERSAQFRHLLDSLREGGLHSVSLTSPGTLTGLGHVGIVLTDCGRCTEGGLWMPVRLKPATHKIISADTFRLTGLTVLAGRGITPEDDWAAPRVAVVSRSLAGREFQDGQPIGRRIYTGDGDAVGSTVVGIVDDQLPIGLGGSLQPRYAVYVSVLQHPPQTVDLLVRDSVDLRVLRKTLQVLGGGSAHYTVNSELQMRAAAVAPVRWFGRRFELQGWALVGLASLGIVGFMRLWVQSLVGEIGVRRSVGALQYQILLLVLWRATRAAIMGVLGGLWFGIAFWGILPSVVSGAVAWDSSRFLESAILAVGLVVCSVLLPAWRVSRARPADLL
jgi:hypothetical protein